MFLYRALIKISAPTTPADHVGLFLVLEDKLSLTKVAPISIDKDGVNFKRHKKLLFTRGLLLIEVANAMRFFFFSRVRACFHLLAFVDSFQDCS